MGKINYLLNSSKADVFLGILLEATFSALIIHVSSCQGHLIFFQYHRPSCTFMPGTYAEAVLLLSLCLRKRAQGGGVPCCRGDPDW